MMGRKTARNMQNIDNNKEYCLAVAAGKTGVHQMLCAVLELLMVGRKTARNMQSIDNNEEYCLAVAAGKPGMHQMLCVQFLSS
jgi:hypothetical protein